LLTIYGRVRPCKTSFPTLFKTITKARKRETESEYPTRPRPPSSLPNWLPEALFVRSLFVNCTAFYRCCHGEGAGLAHPSRASIAGAQNDSVLAYSRSGVCIHQGDCVQSIARAAVLGRPRVASIRRVGCAATEADPVPHLNGVQVPLSWTRPAWPTPNNIGDRPLSSCSGGILKCPTSDDS
jgi:hypothetical protein